MDDLQTLCGRPRTVPALGRRWSLWPLRLMDLGDLQAWLFDQIPDPMPGVLAATAGLGRGARSFALRHATSRRRAMRPTFGSPAAEQLCSSADGLTEILRLSVRRGRPKFGTRGAARLYDALGADESRWLARWAIWGPAGEQQAAGAIGLDADPDADDDDPDKFDWWKLFHTLSLLPNWAESGAGRGWLPWQVARLTLPQVCVLGSDRPPDEGERAEGYEAIGFVRRLMMRKEREIAEWEARE